MRPTKPPISKTFLTIFCASTLIAACSTESKLPPLAGFGNNPTLPKPQSQFIPTVNIANAIGWPANAKPMAAPGAKVEAFAQGLSHPRWLYVLPNGDVLVAESNAPAKPAGEFSLRAWIAGKFMAKAGAGVPSADRITLLRDTNRDGKADARFVLLENLHSPFGMALIDSQLYVANADAIVSFPYTTDDTRITNAGKKLVDLPSGINHHWTKNILASPDGKSLYATVGSNSNVAEHGLAIEEGRAAIWKIDVQTGTHGLFATGLRNPNGLAWEPNSKVLWTVVNERDELGNDLVPDYLTSVQENAFYGWPYSYYGQNVDTRVNPPQPALVAKAISPDYALGAHTASLGLAYTAENALPEHLQHGMFIGQHGSWNRSPKSGYKVIFVPFKDGQANGEPKDVLTGFLNTKDEAFGRPVGVAMDQAGALLVADDVGNTVWRVTKN